jgi:hypothetical protein
MDDIILLIFGALISQAIFLAVIFYTLRKK